MKMFKLLKSHSKCTVHHNDSMYIPIACLTGSSATAEKQHVSYTHVFYRLANWSCHSL